jgi:hypothetical protein
MPFWLSATECVRLQCRRLTEHTVTKECVMSKLLAALVLAAVIASLALVQLYDPSSASSAPDQNDHAPQSSTPHVGFELEHDVGKR